MMRIEDIFDAVVNAYSIIVFEHTVVSTGEKFWTGVTL